MILDVDVAARTPPYQQIRLQIIAGINSGTLEPGDRLPSIRQLAADLDLAINTIGRAYRELENEGVIVTRGRRGTFVRKASTDQGRPALSDEAAVFAERARRLGATTDEAISAVAQALASTPPAESA